MTRPILPPIPPLIQPATAPRRTPADPQRLAAALPAKLPRGTSERPPLPGVLPRATTPPGHAPTRPPQTFEPPPASPDFTPPSRPRPALRPSVHALPGQSYDELPPALPRPDLTSCPRSAGPPPAGAERSPRLRARGTPARDIAPGEQIRTLVFAPEPTRAAWIERELAHELITIQIGRRVRTIVAALVRDPPPRPQILIVDFDVISGAELLELHAIRQDGWFGQLIGLGTVSPELRASLGVDHVLAAPLIRDSLLDCVAGTRHAVVTIACPVIPAGDDHS